MSEVQRVRLSRKSCIMSVLSLYDSSPRVSSSAIASSKACTRETNSSASCYTAFNVPVSTSLKEHLLYSSASTTTPDDMWCLLLFVFC